MKNILIVLLTCLGLSVCGQKTKPIWGIAPDGGIVWQVGKGQVHTDQIEMSGLHISSIVTYGVTNKGLLTIKKKLVFPMLRTIPNNTHASLDREFNEAQQPSIIVNGDSVKEYPVEFQHKGFLTIRSKTNTSVQITRKLFPSVNKAAYIEQFELVNTSDKKCGLELSFVPVDIKTDAKKGVYGEYAIQANSTKSGKFELEPSGKMSFAVIYTGRKPGEEEYSYSCNYELSKREKFVDETFSNLALETPNDTVNQEFAFAKIRATESIYDTKGGLMHGPGGGAYYAAIWANDQAEYVNPFFPFLGNLEGNESAINSYRMFAEYMNPEFKPIPSSIVAEGTSFWNGAGDRGDQAMIAYGASRFALANGNVDLAKTLWPLIEWCLEYCKRQINSEGVVWSDSDELEGRFPAGKANLCTSSLYYDALISASMLGKSLVLPKTQTDTYLAEAKELRTAIEKYFGSNVEGFETYRYYKENTVLRSWICVPLTVGIFERKDATINALFSPRLWTIDGLATQAGDQTFWDRSTLYALRGVFAAGETEKALQYLQAYSARRLLGNHVPYPVEAYPEGNQRHLAAESALYCRIYTEGLFGIRPTGFRTFTCTPRLPLAWPKMELKHINAFQSNFDISVERVNGKLKITISSNNKVLIENLINDGETLSVKL